MSTPVVLRTKVALLRHAGACASALWLKGLAALRRRLEDWSRFALEARRQLRFRAGNAD
ncbi:hypothetical protein [Paenibacillus sacheonensis]|uniref:Uncharacterized protein n=1 Tax=Paenibacillus sacheonensis TaxID=742054 RepID=A0A7X4YUJ5_9BACL|nr:hypothetical protein [Paenibacillus sacheonensis]MBM7567301.1 hypothetical protein [Paenibacillus sacheonensis]NBC72807.1 hypothetical protein [Paenibacillus sacheonensis]